MPNLLEQSKFVDPWGCCVSFFFFSFSLIKHMVFSTNTPFSDFWYTDSQNIKLNLNFMEVQNHNRILRFDVYTHSDGHPVPQEDAIVEQRVPRAIFVSFVAHNRWCD